MHVLSPRMLQNCAVSGQTRIKLDPRRQTGRTIIAMKTVLRCALLLPAAMLIGCTVSPSSSSDTTVPLPSGDWTNWQIQAGAAMTSPPDTYPSFLGAIQIQGTQASGIFSTVESTGTSAALDYSGTYASSTGDIALVTHGFEFDFTQPGSPYTVVPVAVTGGCVGSPPPACLAITSSPSVGVEIAPLNGTYSGTLTDSVDPSFSGTATLTLTQSATPNAGGSFSLGGKLTFPVSSGFGTYPISGTISGEGVTLYDPTPGIVPVVSLTASTNPVATQITVSNLAFAVTASDIVTFTGTLSSQ